MPTFAFARQHRWVLTFGLSTAVCSSFGQTFFISLFATDLMARFHLDSAGWGALYGAATIGSALSLPVLGPIIDKINLKKYVLAIAGMMMMAMLTLSAAASTITLGLGLFMARLSGQGLFSHTAATSVSRYFDARRGAALGITGLGFPLGEALFPLLCVASIAKVGVAQTFVQIAALVGLIYLPLTWFSLRGIDTSPSGFRATAPGSDDDDDDRPAEPSATPRAWTRAEVLAHPGTWLLMGFWVLPACLLTGFFFHQLKLAEQSGWSSTFLAQAFVAFAIARAAFGFLGGPLVDRFGAARLLPLTLLPMGLGFGVLILTRAPTAAFVYFGLLGMTHGLGLPVRSALLAELFGVVHLGAVKSIFFTAAVLSSALSPPLFGWALDAGWNFSRLAGASVAVTLLGSAASIPAVRWLSNPAARRSPR